MNIYDVPEDLFFLDRAQDRTLQAQVREAIVSAVLDGRLLPGARLPSTRKLAKHLQVSRITITLAYQELVGQGYLEASARSSFVVSDAAPRPQLDKRFQAQAVREIDWTAKLPGNLLSRRQIEKPHDWRNFPFPFIYGQMDMSLFHHSAWRDCSRRALGRRDFEDMAQDAAVNDDPMLLDYICSRTLPRRGIAAGTDEILVTVGAQNSLWITIQLLTQKGLHAACENPGYPDIATALRWSGARVSAVDVDHHGLPPCSLPPDVDAVFVTPSHHAPTAVTMPSHRRTELLRAANERDFVIVEDDYEFEIRAFWRHQAHRSNLWIRPGGLFMLAASQKRCSQDCDLATWLVRSRSSAKRGNCALSCCAILPAISSAPSRTSWRWATMTASFATRERLSQNDARS